MATTPIDTDAVRALAELLGDTGLSEIEYDTGELRIRVARTVTVTATAPAAPAAPAADTGASPAASGEAHPGAVTSPMVGVVYLAPEPGAPNFVKIGDTVDEGATLLLIEAMKTFNPLRAPRAGRVAAILASDSMPVEYGEPLVIIE
ncbi:acetyl-CoA carboxylase biotin carboxyl carrier protein [Roseospira marina]|uniref:Biotin carboxyl carrier protein of acetyl-CoA carboxylase n=1 Tax=Roseospira marina TaxID=140057 RepID=A0A5M6IF61_9PROT|nr:acetyl-CoA carboxylase biotin carboxyl carrier protein subunit [Roseospira marina]KAA5606772.1 acetyl-CoA carboxylase biotin carboxyl carrier protein [Roseospira marina]MBB4313806.1 acetyl-CoA carboxylase biotin carboxyl carrier protein [Roseospira marina]MBB5086968.1 acetyl-CoA carboxylase biotin carboxyl carrier protein [Roseospira marina]